MPKIVFIEPNGTQRDVLGQSVFTLMEVAIWGGIDGIEAVCGGTCACATCRVVVEPAWVARLDAPGDQERQLLSTLPGDQAHARLSCQIKVTEQMDGLVVQVADNQGA
ncbi:MAG: 2Fe-2S iron-sulfur cluster-binding protein [Dehalococcoidia bacterium]